ncbi:MAG: hypothetical protein KDK36_17740, partial [Leptospiraceae bacterium]|nr:hypothetical protein [Leptospiraceae bacterium]
MTVFICTPAFGEKTYSWQNLNWKNSLIISDIVDYENYDNQIPSFISFKYPLELSWFSENDLGFPDLQSYSLTFGPINLQKISFPLKGEDAFFIASTVQTFVYNPEISRRDNSSGIPHLWNSSQSPIIGQKRSGRLVLGNNNISMLIDMGFNILGNRAGHSVIDSIVTTL